MYITCVFGHRVRSYSILIIRFEFSDLDLPYILIFNSQCQRLVNDMLPVHVTCTLHGASGRRSDRIGKTIADLKSVTLIYPIYLFSTRNVND